MFELLLIPFENVVATTVYVVFLALAYYLAHRQLEKELHLGGKHRGLRAGAKGSFIIGLITFFVPLGYTLMTNDTKHAGTAIAFMIFLSYLPLAIIWSGIFFIYAAFRIKSNKSNQ